MVTASKFPVELVALPTFVAASDSFLLRGRLAVHARTAVPVDIPELSVQPVLVCFPGGDHSELVNVGQLLR